MTYLETITLNKLKISYPLVKEWRSYRGTNPINNLILFMRRNHTPYNKGKGNKAWRRYESMQKNAFNLCEGIL